MATEDVKPKKAATKKRTTLSHPTYQEMINGAIVALKERNGSSQYAISRFIEEKQKQLPPTFRKKLLFSLKNLVKSGKIVKVKSSFKLPSSAKPEKKPVAAKSKAPAKAKPVPVKVAAVAKPKERPAKVARTSPGKKPKKVAAAAKKSPAKTAKSKSVKTPTKKVLPRKAKK